MQLIREKRKKINRQLYALFSTVSLVHFTWPLEPIFLWNISKRRAANIGQVCLVILETLAYLFATDHSMRVCLDTQMHSDHILCVTE